MSVHFDGAYNLHMHALQTVCDMMLLTFKTQKRYSPMM